MLDLYVYIPLFSFHDWLFLDNINKDGSSTQPSNTDVSCKLPLKKKRASNISHPNVPTVVSHAAQTRPSSNVLGQT